LPVVLPRIETNQIGCATQQDLELLVNVLSCGFAKQYSWGRNVMIPDIRSYCLKMQRLLVKQMLFCSFDSRAAV